MRRAENGRSRRTAPSARSPDPAPTAVDPPAPRQRYASASGTGRNSPIRPSLPTLSVPRDPLTRSGHPPYLAVRCADHCLIFRTTRPHRAAEYPCHAAPAPAGDSASPSPPCSSAAASGPGAPRTPRTSPTTRSPSTRPPRAPRSTTRCTGSSSRTSTAPPTAVCTPSWCRTAPSSTPPPTTARYTPLTALDRSEGGTGAEVVNDDGRLNERNRTLPRLAWPPAGGRYGVTNAGYNTGIARRGRARGTTSRCGRAPTSAGTPLTVSLAGRRRRQLAAARWRHRARRPLDQVHRHASPRPRTSTAGRLTVPPAGTRHAPARHGLAVPARHLQRPPERPAQGPRREDRRAEAGLRPLPRRLPGQHRQP